MKQLLNPSNATFNFTAKTITFATTVPSTISHILHVTNVTRGVLYFQPQAGISFSGTYSSPVLTLNCSTAGHDDSDKLEIFYDDGLSGSNSTLQDSANTKLDSLLTELQLKADLTETQPVSLASIPLATGAATDAGITGASSKTLTDINTTLGSPLQAGGTVVVSDGTNNISISTVVGDAASLTANRVRASAVLMSSNGASVDMVRSGITSDAGAATGYLNTLPATGAVSGALLTSSSAYEASRVIKASAGTLISLIGYNSLTSSQFIQIFNSTTVPANGAVPIYTFTVPGSSNFSLDVPITGVPFSTGISVCNSSSAATKTLGSANCFFTVVYK